MKIKDALKLAKLKLKDHADVAEFILCELLGHERAWLHLNGEADFDAKPYFSLVRRFARGEPFEYLFKKVSFYGLDFIINRGVLIPRFDSEILLEICLKELRGGTYKRILEIGFGSGILSIVLAKNLGVKITACDTSKKALRVALQNAKLHKVEHLIDFKLCDYQQIEASWDFVFSNPPYIAKNYPLDIWVQKEPKFALFGGERGWEMLENIVLYAKSHHAKALACEFGYDQKEILHKILHKNGFKAEFSKDSGGFDRAFLARGLVAIRNENMEK